MMRYITPSKFSKSGGCCKFLNHLCNKKRINLSNSDRINPNFGQNSSQRAGDIVHKIVQYALEGDDIYQRKERIKKIENIIVKIKLDFEINNHLDEIIGNENHLDGVIHDLTIKKIITETLPLINGAIKLLRKIEDMVPNSENKWTVTSEGETKGINDTKIKILGEEMTLHGSIDLVFEYKKFAVICELKTGTPEDYKIKKWELQTQMMAKAWKIKHPNNKILAYIINSELKNGRREVEIKNSTVDELQNKDIIEVIPGFHCRECPESHTCKFSEI